MSPVPPPSPSYRDDRYAVYAAGGVTLLGALVAVVLSTSTVETVAPVADALAVPLALAGVGLLVAATGTGGETVHRRVVSDTRGRRLLLLAGGFVLFVPSVTTLTDLVIGDGGDTAPEWEALALLAAVPVVLAVCWRLLDAVRARYGEDSTLT
ncbi:hypothetical protein [Halomarina oriensis]|uniref:Uncharacterized protein n=1 Tax=Halomarina oriensis TaxID=671145 RepID=A0A6B0GM49_9EURY|nr:hypothetical protein [Halomarina oriensis]MWG35804.1 hypothetical protein [Halomarina oriensis]